MLRPQRKGWYVVFRSRQYTVQRLLFSLNSSSSLKYFFNSYGTKKSCKIRVPLLNFLVFGREEWTKAIQAVADSLQKQEEERMDSSPDPMDMEMYLSKPRLKVVESFLSYLLFLYKFVR